jgi:hypothetical protein
VKHRLQYQATEQCQSKLNPEMDILSRSLRAGNPCDSSAWKIGISQCSIGSGAFLYKNIVQYSSYTLTPFGARALGVAPTHARYQVRETLLWHKVPRARDSTGSPTPFGARALGVALSFGQQS